MLTDSAAMLQSQEAEEEKELANEAQRVPALPDVHPGTRCEGGLLQQAAGMQTCRLVLSMAAGSGAELRR